MAPSQAHRTLATAAGATHWTQPMLVRRIHERGPRFRSLRPALGLQSDGRHRRFLFHQMHRCLK